MSAPFLLVVSTGEKIPGQETGAPETFGTAWFDQMLALKVLQQRLGKRLGCCFDERLSFNGCPEDVPQFDAIASLVKESNYFQIKPTGKHAQVVLKISSVLQETQWWKGYHVAVKTTVRMAAGREDVMAICLPGGAITDVEHMYMNSIIATVKNEARSVQAQLGRVNVQYWDFSELLQELQEEWTPEDQQKLEAMKATQVEEEEKKKASELAMWVPMSIDEKFKYAKTAGVPGAVSSSCIPLRFDGLYLHKLEREECLFLRFYGDDQTVLMTGTDKEGEDRAMSKWFCRESGGDERIGVGVYEVAGDTIKFGMKVPEDWPAADYGTTLSFEGVVAEALKLTAEAWELVDVEFTFLALGDLPR